MRLTKLYLRNYRVYEDELELEVPPGLVGVYGPNGAGKSYLIESIPWTLYGVARTSKEHIRTSGVSAECITEVEFEHEGRLYRVRRTVTGQNHTVKAAAWADDSQVSEGVRDTATYVQSILGMDAAAFKASVFAEQKQLAAFSNEPPAKRRELVLRLLGITPLDVARDAARKDAKAIRDTYDLARRALPDLSLLESGVVEAQGAALAAVSRQRELAATATQAKADAEEAEKRFAALDLDRQAHERVVADGRAVARERDDAAKQVSALEAELTDLAGAADELTALQRHAVDVESAERELAAIRRVADAYKALAALAAHDEPDKPDAEAVETTTHAATEAAAAVAALDGSLRAARDAAARAAQSLERSALLTPDEDCPMCGQALGDSFHQVVEHRKAEAADAIARVKQFESERKKAAATATQAKQRADAAKKTFEQRRAAWQLYERSLGAREQAQQGLVTAIELLRGIDDTRVDLTADEADRVMRVLTDKVEGARRAAARASEITGRLQRRPIAETALVEHRGRLAVADRRRTELLAEVRALAFDPAVLDTARRAHEAARLVAETAGRAAHEAEIDATRATAAVESAEARLADGRAQHERLDALSHEARHVGRTAELLGAFRNQVVASVGPMLAEHAANLFGELTDREYDHLEVDPETFEIRVTDAGISYGMDRFSGSEVDLANLSLRVAISENVRLQSGGAVGLLVLDEVFGPLDDERRERMLGALERLKARFRQVMVVTHANDVKEQLPSAIEVVKRPGRRATARLLVG